MILALGTRPMGPTDSQVYFAFCIFKAAVEIAFAFYTMWQWNVLFVVMQAESWGLDWLVVGSAKCCQGFQVFRVGIIFFACLSTGGINPKDKKKGIISIGSATDTQIYLCRICMYCQLQIKHVDFRFPVLCAGEEVPILILAESPFIVCEPPDLLFIIFITRFVCCPHISCSNPHTA